jgi:biopolymer transport protein ExbD
VNVLRFAAIVFLTILVGCRENAAPVAKPHGSSLPDLVTAEGAPLFATETPYTEVVRMGDVWKVYDQGELLGEQRLDDEGIEVFKQAHERVRSRKGEGRILLAAGGKVAFGEIRSAIRAAAKAGFWRIEFLVKSSTKTGICSLRLDLPTMDGKGNPWPREPLQFQVRSDGSIHEGEGSGRNTLESSSGTSRLDAYLKSVEQNARHTKSTPEVQAYADSEAPFQRVIDVLAGLQVHGISEVYFIDPAEYDRVPDPRIKPRSPRASQ